MGTIYQLTIFLALALLAIVAAVFVLAVSLLGRAVKMAAEEQEKAAREQKDATEKEIFVAGAILPPDLPASEFRWNYETAYSTNPALPPDNVWDLFGYLSTDATPIVIITFDVVA